jgi:transcriptional regulator with XRE-family HTH domain
MANLTPLACRAARALLEMSARELGEKAGVALETINKFENGRPMRESTKAKLAFVLESAGVEILNGDAPGARLRTGLVPDEPLASSEDEALLARIARQIEFTDALQDAGLDLSKLRLDPKTGLPHQADLTSIDRAALLRLLEDPRVKAIAQDGE